MDWPDGVSMAVRRLERAGFEAYAVGGCVRDALLNRAPEDWDVCTSARPDAVKRVFSDARVIETGIRHGTVTVIFMEQKVEVTTFRTDGRYSDHRRPDSVNFVLSLRHDLARRDFTINAMAARVGAGVIDYFGGQADLAARLIRCVGDAKARFAEDALRILRALRFAAQLDFSIEGETARALTSMRARLKYISAQRIAGEIKKLLVAPGAGRILAEYRRVIEEATGVKDYDAAVVARLPPDAALRLAVLTRSSDVAQTLRRLRFDNQTVERAQTATELAKRPMPEDERQALTLLNAAGDEGGARDALQIWRAEGRDTAAAEAIIDHLTTSGACYRVGDLAINGKDLVTLGFQGALIGRALNTLLTRVMAGELANERTALIDAARKIR